MGIGAKSFEGRSVLGKVLLTADAVDFPNAYLRRDLVCPCDGEIVDVIFTQAVAGEGGDETSVSVAVALPGEAPALPALAVDPVIPLAAGALKTVAVRQGLPAVAGATRPVLGTKARRQVKRGANIVVSFSKSGIYNPAMLPSCAVTIVIKPVI